MKKILFILILILTSLSTSQAAHIDSNAYKDYLSNIYGSQNQDSLNIFEVKNYSEIETWLAESETILDKKIKNRIKSRLLISISKLGYIEKIEILDLKQNDFDSFRNLIAELNDTRLLDLPDSILEKDSNKVIDLVLDSELLFFERISAYHLDELDSFSLKETENQKINKKQIIKDLSEVKEIKAKLAKPNYIDYAKIGDFLELTTDSLSLHGRIENIDKDKIQINIKQIESQSQLLPCNLSFDLHTNQSKNFTVELIHSGLNTAFQGGIINAISSYGIVPGALALAGATGKALQINETSTPINLSRGDLITLKKGEK